MAEPLPIDAVLPELVRVLARDRMAVLEAPPGAGKTTRVPLAVLEAGLTEGRILVLEPRRVAARAAAERMASTLGEPVGARVGYRIRGEAKAGRETRIEVVTEGILTRMLNTDPGLEGVGLVIFDEFHERSIHTDLGLALCLEVQSALRDDLGLLVMSATLDGAAVAGLMGAEVVRSEGRAFPVEIRHAERPRPRDMRLEAAVAEATLAALAVTEGGVLVFLPGEGEIRRTLARLEGRLPGGCVLRPLYGALPFAAQRAAIAPEPGARKIVLATAIAETSLTIEDVRVVVDAGLARRSRFDPGTGMARLVTEPASRAEIEQRRGRAGRVAPGVCHRLWTRAEEGQRPAYAPPEITSGDLAGLALDLAAWGAREVEDLPFLTPPGDGPFAAARRLLTDLGALDAGGAITDHGRALSRLPLHPRLAHMLSAAGAGAAPLAALLADRDPMRGAGSDLALRLKALERGDPRADTGGLDRIRGEARRLRRLAPGGSGLTPAQAAALAYPDRIGLRRPGDAPRFVLSGGTGAKMDAEDTLAGARLIVATETDGDRREARIRQAIAIPEAELREVLGDRIAWHELCAWSRREGRVVARRQERLGAVILDDRIWQDAPDAALARAMLDGVREIGLVWTPAAARFRVARGTGARGRLRAPRLLGCGPDGVAQGLAPAAPRQGPQRGGLAPVRPRPGPRGPARLGRAPGARQDRPAAFHDTTRAQGPHRLRRRDPLGRGPAPGALRAHPAPHNRRPAPPPRPSLPRGPPGPGDDRPAGLLGHELCRCQKGHARPLPETPLARGPHRGRPHNARKTPRVVICAGWPRRGVCTTMRPGPGQTQDTP